jgi:hypothetical protein
MGSRAMYIGQRTLADYIGKMIEKCSAALDFAELEHALQELE